MSVLDEIVRFKREELGAIKRKCALADLKARVADCEREMRGFMAALERRVQAQRAAVIAEIKRASPSMGLIARDFDPVAIARGYEKAGACCLSVLTDARFFQGSGADLEAVRGAVQLPLLRKDFMVDEYQFYEAFLLGADAVLLIAAVLDDAELADFCALAHDLGLDVLVEVHDEAEFERALRLPLGAIGVNNRNLHDFTVDLAVSLRLNQRLPEGRFLITESGVRTHEDVVRLMDAGIYAFLVGTAFMRLPVPAEGLKSLFFS